MAIINLGSINIDMVYRVSHLPQPGETLAADDVSKGLGGKGANMSVAASRAGSQVLHIGAVGDDGAWAVDRLGNYGVDVSQIAQSDAPTGHAIIAVDEVGENQIILYPGANTTIEEIAVDRALSDANSGDSLIIQNETNLQAFAARRGKEAGLRVCYAAAPFDAEDVEAVLPYVDLMFLNEVEMAQLKEATGKDEKALDTPMIIVTKGSEGCSLYRNGIRSDFSAPKVHPVDTTGAGDTFTGYVIAGLDQGLDIEDAVSLATKAAALMVTRLGTADVIPELEEVESAVFP